MDRVHNNNKSKAPLILTLAVLALIVIGVVFALTPKNNAGMGNEALAPAAGSTEAGDAGIPAGTMDQGGATGNTNGANDPTGAATNTAP
jgi:hypothetical protein